MFFFRINFEFLFMYGFFCGVIRSRYVGDLVLILVFKVMDIGDRGR